MNTAAAVFLIFLICFGCLIAFGFLIDEYFELRSEIQESQSLFQQEEHKNQALHAQVPLIEDNLLVCEGVNEDLEHENELLLGEKKVLMAQLAKEQSDQEKLAADNRRLREQLNRANRLLRQYSTVMDWAGEHPFEILFLPAGIGLATLTTAGLARRRPGRDLLRYADPTRANQSQERSHRSDVQVRMSREQAHQYSKWLRDQTGKGD